MTYSYVCVFPIRFTKVIWFGGLWFWSNGLLTTKILAITLTYVQTDRATISGFNVLQQTPPLATAYILSDRNIHQKGLYEQNFLMGLRSCVGNKVLYDFHALYPK